MKLYKFRSLENLEFTLDILLNQRLHCALFEKLNDPLEGVFMWVFSGGGTLAGSALNEHALGGSIVMKTPTSISELHLFGDRKVCSLSASLNDVRLWSHYADGHTGIAIEIDIDESDSALHKVEYVDTLKEFSASILGGPRSEEVLKLKTTHWSYEHEYRIISSDDFYSVDGRITGIYLGLRTSELLRQALLGTVGDE